MSCGCRGGGTALPPPLGDGLTPSLTVLLVYDNCILYYNDTIVMLADAKF